MTEKMGLEAVLIDDKFIAGLKNYMSGIVGSTQATYEAAKSFVGFGKGLDDAGDGLGDTGKGAVALASKIDKLVQSHADGEISAERYNKELQKLTKEGLNLAKSGTALEMQVEKLTKAFKNGDMSSEEYTKGLHELALQEDSTAKSSHELEARINLMEKAYEQAKQVIETGIGLAELGAAFERQERRFEAFSGSAEQAQANLKAFQQGAGGTVNKMEAMSSASRLLQMGLVQDADEMEKVVEMATRLGDQTASAGVRVSDFALMLANTSIPRLDAYGISAGFVRGRMKELQDANEDMTREQAFSKAVYEAGADSLAILGDRVDDNAAKMEKARARLEDYRIEMGQKVMPLVSRAAGVIAELDTATIALVTTLTSLVAAGAKFSGGLGGEGGLIRKLGLTEKQFGALAIAGVAMIGVYESIRDIQQDVAEGIEESTAAAAAWGDEIQDAVAAGRDLNEVAVELAERSNEGRDALTGFSGALTMALGGQEALEVAADTTRDAIIREAASVFEAREAILAFNATIEDEIGLIKSTRAPMSELVKSRLLGVSSTAELNALIAGQVEELREEKQATEELTIEQIRATKARFELSDALQAGDVEEARAVLEKYAEELGIIGRAAEIYVGQLEEQNAVLERQQEAQEQSRQATAESTQSARDQMLALEEVESTWFDQQNAAIRGAQVQDEWNVKAEEAKVRAEDMAVALEEETQALEDEAQAQEAAAEAAEAHTLALLDQAEALSDADAAEAAKAAISGLTDLLNEGTLTLEEYDALVRDVQDDYGLVGEEGRALAEGMAVLNEQLASGALSAEAYRTQLDALIESQVASIDATKAEAEAQKELDKEIERAAKDAERTAERERDKAEREAEKLAEKIRRDVEREMEAAARAAEELPSRLFDALSKLGSTAMRTLKDEMKPLDEELGRIDDGLEIWKRALEDPIADLQDQETALAKIAELEAERAQVAAERAEQEEKILAFQEAQQQMQLLQQQLDLLELVQEHGLDAQNILGGLGADASASDIVEATTEAMQQIIEQMSGGLGEGAQSMTQAPVYAPSSTSSTSTSSQTNHFDLGGNNINNGMDLAQLEAMIRRVMAEAING